MAIRVHWLFVLFLSVSVWSQSTRYVYIPDPNFRQFIQTNYPGFMKGDSLNVDSAATITEKLDCSGQGIHDLTGIQYFIHITDLRCSYNYLTELPDISTLQDLTFLFCENNQLTSLPDLSRLSSLTGLWCSNNRLTQLPDLSQLKLLQFLNCSNNQLTELPDLSANKNLTHLYCSSNQLQKLPDLSQLSGLTALWCYNNQLDSLPDLSHNTQLTDLRCYDNSIRTIPGLGALHNLTDFYCQNNKITQVDGLANAPHLRTVNISNNVISQLPDFSNQQELEEFYCQLNKLDFSDARELKIIDRLPSLTTFEYAPQKPFGQRDTLQAVQYLPFSLTISPQDSAQSYQWLKNGEVIPGANGPVLHFSAIQMSDSGIYQCRVQGTALSNMNHGSGITSFISEPIVLQVLPGNHAPYFITEKLDTALVAHPYAFQLQAEDADNNQLHFSAIGLPSWLHLSSSGQLSGTPAIGDTGNFPLQFIVTDDGNPPFSDTLTTTLVVILANHPPRFLTTTLDTALVGHHYQFTLQASDPDGDSLIFAALQMPSWLHLSPAGILSGTPQMSDMGQQQVTIRVQDSGLPPLADTLRTVLTIQLGNHAPVFLTHQLDTAYEGLPYRFQLQAKDTDGDSLIFSAIRLPQWLALSPQGELQGTPSLADTGKHLLTIAVRDNGIPPLADTLQLSLWVAPNPIPPTVSLSILQNPVLTQFANLIVSTDLPLQSFPQVWMVSPADSVPIPMDTIPHSQNLFSGSIEFHAEGRYRFHITVTKLNGLSFTTTKNIQVALLQPGREKILASPDENVRLHIPAGTFTQAVYLYCQKESTENDTVYTFSPGIELPSPAILEMTYSDDQFPEAKKLFIYQKEGEEWKPLTSVVYPQTHRVRAQIHSFGTFKLAVNEDFDGSNLVPQQNQLLPNFPNPFNPSTTIAYQLAEDGMVSLIIFNSLGQPVRRLFQGFQIAGRYQWRWDGRDDRGQLLPSGIYYYRLQGRHFHLTRKMLFIH